MKRARRYAMAIMIMSVVVVSLWATGSGEQSETQNMTSMAGAGPTEVTMFFQEGGQKFPDGYDHNDNPFFQLICELANIEVTDLIVPAYADTKTKFNLLMASGDIPDLVERSDIGAMKQYGEEGAFLPVKEIIEKSPVLSQWYDPVQLATLESEDGVAYILRNQSGTLDYGCMAIRTDLLEEIGMDVPATTDELLAACRALKQRYPDSTPIVVRGAVWAFMGTLFLPFDIPGNGTGWMYDYETGKARNSFEGQNIVDAVEYIKLLYSEGLIDPEFITTGSGDYWSKIKLEDNHTLAFDRNIFSLSYVMQLILDTGQENARLAPVPFVTADGYDYGAYQAQSPTGPYAFGINAKIKEETLPGVVRYLETLYSDEVLELALYGREGIEFQRENGGITPILPASTDTVYRSLYSWMRLYSMEKLLYTARTRIFSSAILSDGAKNSYYQQFLDTDAAAREFIYGKVGYNPMALAKPIADEFSNRATECKEKQKNLIAKAIFGEISIDEFMAEKEKVVAKYADITEAYNIVIAEAMDRYNIDQYGFAKK